MNYEKSSFLCGGRMLTLLLISAISALLVLSCDDDDGPTGGGGKDLGPEGRIYVPNQADGTMYIYDSKTLDRVDSFDIPINEPHFITFDNDYEYYYVVGREIGGQVAKYKASNDSLITVITVEGQVFPTAAAIGANNDTLYLTDFTNAAGRTHRYNVSGDNFIWIDSQLQAGHQTHDNSMSPDGRILVTAGYNSDDIWVVNTQTGDQTPLTLDSAQPIFNPQKQEYGPYGVQVDLNGTMAIVACRTGDDQIRLIDLVNQTVLDSILVPVSNDVNPKTNGPTYMTLLPDNNTLFVTTFLDNTVAVVRLSTREVLKFIEFSAPKPFTAWSTDDGTRVYVSCTNTRPANGMVYVIDTESLEKIDSIEVGSEPFGLSWRPLVP